jgi:hypothetical protein
MDRFPVLLEKATRGQDDGTVYVPRFIGLGIFATSTEADEKMLLGRPSHECRGLALGLQSGAVNSTEIGRSAPGAVFDSSARRRDDGDVGEHAVPSDSGNQGQRQAAGSACQRGRS